ncbi:MAG: prolyl oligopeptidase family serine peptidase [Myxococcota bacterium]
MPSSLIASFVVASAFVSACAGEPRVVRPAEPEIERRAGDDPEPPAIPPPPDHDVVMAVDAVVVEVRVPSGPVRGQILMLPGWSFDRRETCWRSSFCEEALAKGYLLVLAGMDKSIYAGRVYSETRSDMAHYKTRTWVTERFIPALQRRLHVLLPGGDNYLYGMSTGGRGVALLAMHTGSLFKAGAALSGDFDMTEETNDPLLLLHYGSYRRFPERWTGDDNPAMHVDRITVPLYIASGTDDRTVSPSQSVKFHAKMQSAHPDLDVRLHMVDGGGHDFDFWGGETGRVLEFFAAHGTAPAADPDGVRRELEPAPSPP